MKIGILTFHRSINYGAFIQCYSLVNRIKSDFPDCDIEVIDYHMPKIDEMYDISPSKYFKGSLKHKIGQFIKYCNNPLMFSQSKKRKKAFQTSLCYLPLSNNFIYSDETNQLFEYINNNLDIVVVGSDAVWNYVVRGFPNPYYLDSSIKVPKLTYAASCFGMNYELLPKIETEKINKSLSSYKFLGVRDSESEKFVKYIGCDNTCIHTCDPTVFLNVNNLPEEDSLLSKLKKTKFDFSKQTVAVMGVTGLCKMVREILGNEYQIVSLYEYSEYADVSLCYLTPFEWVHFFKRVKVTFATKFHGTLLSLRCGTPVIATALNNSYAQKHITKVEDFLQRVGMSDCYFKTDYNGLNYQEIKIKFEHLLSIDRGEIVKAMDEEALCYKPFYDALKLIISNTSSSK